MGCQVVEAWRAVRQLQIDAAAEPRAAAAADAVLARQDEMPAIGRPAMHIDHLERERTSRTGTGSPGACAEDLVLQW